MANLDSSSKAVSVILERRIPIDGPLVRIAEKLDVAKNDSYPVVIFRIQHAASPADLVIMRRDLLDILLPGVK